MAVRLAENPKPTTGEKENDRLMFVDLSIQRLGE